MAQVVEACNINSKNALKGVTMEIKSNIIKNYLRNVFFINGTAYAGKSTMCAMLAKKYKLIHCKENYCADKFLEIATANDQPNMTYFKTHEDWQKFLNRTPVEYASWIDGNSREMAEFEIAELIRISADQRVIVDTNIPVDMLKEIADYNQVAIMISPQSMSVNSFFDRKDPEKQFLLSQIQKAENPEKTMANFKECLAMINSQKVYDDWADCGFYGITREDATTDTREETLRKLSVHFGLSEK